LKHVGATDLCFKPTFDGFDLPPDATDAGEKLGFFTNVSLLHLADTYRGLYYPPVRRKGGAMRKMSICRALGALALMVAARGAEAHGIAGNRFFVGTLTIDDPAVADELSNKLFDYVLGDRCDDTAGETPFHPQAVRRGNVTVLHTT
jgi:hypothetical protein